MKRTALTLLLIFTIFLGFGKARADYDYTAVNCPGAAFTYASGINNAGQIVGSYGDSNGFGRGFLLSGGTYSPLNYPGAVYTDAYGINNAGQIVGDFGALNGNGYSHAFILSGSVYSPVSQYIYPVGQTQNWAFGINDVTFPSWPSQIVGSYEVGSPGIGSVHGILYPGAFLDYPGATNTGASGINNAGQIVGSYTDNSGVRHGFLLTGYTMYSAVDYPGAIATTASGINNMGEIVGTYEDSNQRYHGFLFNGSTYTSFDYPASGVQTFVNGINDKGQIVGTYEDASFAKQGFLATPVPIPSSVLLLLPSLVGLARLRRKHFTGLTQG